MKAKAIVVLHALVGDFINLGVFPDADAANKQILAGYPIGRTGTPRDVADAILFLASDMSRFVTGELIHVDGGFNAMATSMPQD